MSIVKPKNFSYIKGPKGDKGDRGEPGSGVAGSTGRITYNSTTKTVGFNETGLATTAYVNSTINNMVNGAPLVLDTLNELAAAIGDNPNFVIDINANINGKLSLAGGTMSGALILNANPTTNLQAATKQYVDNATSSIVTSYNDLTDKPTIPNSIFDLGVPDVTIPENIPGYLSYNGTSLSWQAVNSFSGRYADLTGKPTLVTSYTQLTEKPILFSGNYNDLTNKPAPAHSDRLVNGDYIVALATTGQLNLPGAANTESNNARIQSANSIDILSNLAKWTFGTDGSLTLPIGVSIDNSVSPLYPKIIADSGKAFSIQGQGNSGSAALAWTVDPNAAGQYAAVSVSRGGGDNLAKVVLQAQSDSGDVATAKTWKFDETGILTLPADGDIKDQNGNSVLGGSSGPTDRLVNGSKQVVLQSNGYITLANGAQLYDYGSGAGNGYGITDSLGGTYIGYDPDDAGGALHMDSYNGKNIRVRTTPAGTSNYKDWLFDSNGILSIPVGGDIKQNGVSVLGGTNYTLPTATTNILGGVKVDGSTITINDGIISSVGGSATAVDGGGDFEASGSDPLDYSDSELITDGGEFGGDSGSGDATWSTLSDKNNAIKLPVTVNGRSGTGEYGCNNVSNGDIVFVEGYNDSFKVTAYDSASLRYLPF
jgi:hypothetical protein